MPRPEVGFAHESTAIQTDDWWTPKFIFDRLGLDFDLDPAAPAGGVPWIPCRRFYTPRDDGLQKPWFGRVWLNPPYGQATPRWLERMVAHGDGIALLFSRTDTRWFHEFAPTAAVACFLRGRIRFVRPSGEEAGTPGTGSMLLAWGMACGIALARADLGLCVIPNDATAKRNMTQP